MECNRVLMRAAGLQAWRHRNTLNASMSWRVQPARQIYDRQCCCFHLCDVTMLRYNVHTCHLRCQEIETKTEENQLLEEECDELKLEVEAAQAHLAHAKKGEVKMHETAKKLCLHRGIFQLVCHCACTSLSSHVYSLPGQWFKHHVFVWILMMGFAAAKERADCGGGCPIANAVSSPAPHRRINGSLRSTCSSDSGQRRTGPSTANLQSYLLGKSFYVLIFLWCPLRSIVLDAKVSESTSSSVSKGNEGRSLHFRTEASRGNGFYKAEGEGSHESEGDQACWGVNAATRGFFDKGACRIGGKTAGICLESFSVFVCFNPFLILFEGQPYEGCLLVPSEDWKKLRSLSRKHSGDMPIGPTVCRKMWNVWTRWSRRWNRQSWKRFRCKRRPVISPARCKKFLVPRLVDGEFWFWYILMHFDCYVVWSKFSWPCFPVCKATDARKVAEADLAVAHDFRAASLNRLHIAIIVLVAMLLFVLCAFGFAVRLWTCEELSLWMMNRAWRLETFVCFVVLPGELTNVETLCNQYRPRIHQRYFQSLKNLKKVNHFSIHGWSRNRTLHTCIV